MKKVLSIAAILAVTMLFTSAQFAQGKKAPATDKKVVNKVCLVSGEDLDKKPVTFEYKGKTYGVCCKKCLAKLKADPEKYIQKLGPDGKLKKS